MNIKTLKEYMSLCDHFKIKPSFEHLNKYNKKIMEVRNVSVY